MIGDFHDRAILVTGGAGFIGSHLVEALVQCGARVSVMDNLSNGRRENLSTVRDRIYFRTLDLRHSDLRPLLSENLFDIIFHIAGNANVPGSVKDPWGDFENNAVATLRLLEAVREAAPQTQIIHTSSAAVYGEGVRSPITEDDPTPAVSPYGVSKLAAEQYLSVYARLYGLRTANLRLFSVYGPRLQKQVVYDLMCKIQNNPRELLIFGDGTQVRDFNHVTNVVAALLTVAERSRLEGEVYNVAAEEPVSIQQLAQMVCERMGATPRFVYSGDVRPGEPQRWYPNISRLKGLGYRTHLGLAEGLSDTVGWFKREMPIAG